MLSSGADRRWLYKMVIGTAKVNPSRRVYSQLRYCTALHTASRAVPELAMHPRMHINVSVLSRVAETGVSFCGI